MSVVDGLVRALLPLVPRRLVWTVARRYVAGAELADALARIGPLRERGFGTILDVLGEGVEDEAAARAAVAEYERAIAGLSGVDDDCPISVKPTHLGQLVRPGLCEELLAGLCEQAAAAGRRVRLEMEDHPTVEGTLAAFEVVRREHANLGCVLQARLFRTESDIQALLESDLPLNVRMVKGIYLEPASVAWTEDADISRRYVADVERLLEGGAFVGLATHDERLAEACLEVVGRLGAEDRYEFQCLMGVREKFAESLRAAGHPVRIYVPYGRDWHAYSMRRLDRNPTIARHIMKAALGLG